MFLSFAMLYWASLIYIHLITLHIHLCMFIRPNGIWNKIICEINKWSASSMVTFPLE